MVRTVICFGDSNTHGYAAKTNGRYSETERWPGVLQELLGKDYAVKEEGLSGRTAVFDDPLFEGLSGLSYLYPCMMSHEPVDLLIVMLGTNDVKARFSACPANIAKGLERLITKAIRTKEAWRGEPEVLVIAPPPIRKEYESTPIYGEMGADCAEKSEKLAGFYQELSARLNCAFLDAGSIPGLRMSEPDYMHLSKEGHRILGEAVAREVERIFEG